MLGVFFAFVYSGKYKSVKKGRGQRHEEIVRLFLVVKKNVRNMEQMGEALGVNGFYIVVV